MVDCLKKSGAIIVGKTVTTEFAWRDAGPTTNPWNVKHTPGGSSSGSAAAVAAGMVDIAVGTHTLGSVIRPASYCGCVGYKPTFDLISREGVYPLSSTLDHVGFLTSSCYWAAATYMLGQDMKSSKDVLKGFDRGEKPLKIGIYRSSQWHWVEDEVKANFDAVVRHLTRFGIAFTCVDLDLDILDITQQAIKTTSYEANQEIYPKVCDRLDEIGPYSLNLMLEGQEITPEAYQALLKTNQKMREHRDDLFQDIDLIMSITSPTTAPEDLSYTGDAMFCTPWTYLGLPTVTIPSGLSRDFLPIGLQLIGQAGCDLKVLKFAQWISNRLPEFKRASVAFE
ncbi:amidase [Acinetobacter sp. EC24]|nr:amidase [Acinetobacter rathckeae]